MSKILLVSFVAATLIGIGQAEAHHRHWHHGADYGHSGSVGRLGLGASPKHPEGPGNPGSGK
jgi:hypothetical protein